VDGSHINNQQTLIQDLAVIDNFGIDYKAEACNKLNYQLPNRDGHNNSIIPIFVKNMVMQYL
jgi:hypothetical protein